MNAEKLWKYSDIGMGLKLTCGFPFASQYFSSDHGFPLIRIRDILQSKIETYYDGIIPPGYLIRKDDILIGMDGDFHVVKWKNEDALLNQRVLKVDVQNNTQLSLDFIYFWLQPYVKKINDLTAATTVKHLSTKDIFKAKGYLPSRKVQQKIATILTSIDTAIEKTEALIEKYQQIKSGLMHDLFTRGVLPSGQLRPTREQAPELYQETKIGWIPKEWKFCYLGTTLAKIESGWSPDCQETTPTIGEWGVLKVSAVTRGFYDYRESKTLPKHLNPIPSLEVKNGDVIMTRANGVAELVGKCVRVLDTQEKLMLSDKLLRLVPNVDVMEQDYLGFLMSSNYVTQQIDSSMNGSSGQRNISQADIKSFMVPIPNKIEQIIMGNKLSAHEHFLECEVKKLKKLHNQKLGLMQDLLTGKVPVTVLENADQEEAHA